MGLEDKQLYEVTLVSGEVTLARYYEKMVALNDRSGFELRGARFCEENVVATCQKITEAKAQEKYGY